jgi:hypothetical protein
VHYDSVEMIAIKTARFFTSRAQWPTPWHTKHLLISGDETELDAIGPLTFGSRSSVDISTAPRNPFQELAKAAPSRSLVFRFKPHSPAANRKLRLLMWTGSLRAFKARFPFLQANFLHFSSKPE